MLTKGDKWGKQFQKAAKHLVQTKGVLNLCLWRNLEVPQNESPSIYNIKLQYGDCSFFTLWSKYWQVVEKGLGLPGHLGLTQAPFSMSASTDSSLQPPHALAQFFSGSSSSTETFPDSL